MFAALGCSALQRTSPDSNPQDENWLSIPIHQEELLRATPEDARIPASSEAEYNFMRGELALSEAHFEEALQYFEIAARLEPAEAPTLRRRLAQLYVREGKLDEALRQLDLVDVDDTESLELRAGILATLKRLPEAIAAYRRLIAISPDKPDEDAYVLLASLFAENGDLASAKQTLEELISRDPQSVFGYYYLARVREAQGDPAEAERLFRKALEINPNSEAIKLDLARSYGAQHRYTEGAAIVNEVIQANPQNIAARSLLGQLLVGDNRLDEALKAYENLGELEDDPTQTRFKIALIKLERRDYAGAETELNLVLAKSPGNMAARYYLALAYAGTQRTDDALKQLQKIRPQDGLYIESRLLSSYLLRQDKRLEEAAAIVKEALKEKGDDARLLSFLGSLQRELDQPAEAVETVKRLIAVEPESDSNYFLLGVLHDDLKQKEEALAAMRRAIAINPKNADALNYLAYSLAELGQDLDEAERLVKRALAMDAKNAYYVDTLGWVYFKGGRMKDAVRELERAVTATGGQDAVIYEHLALVYEQAGERAKAREAAERALPLAPKSDDKEVLSRLKILIERLDTKGREAHH